MYECMTLYMVNKNKKKHCSPVKKIEVFKQGFTIVQEKVV